MSVPLELAVVIPTFNERENAPELIARLDSVLRGIEYELIVVDDDSPDGTADAVRGLARTDRRIRVIQRLDRRGLASACVEGFLASAAPYLAVIDADLQHDESLLPAMLAKLRSEPLDLVIGTRYAGGGSAAALGAWRGRLSAFGNRLSRIVTRSALTDPMSGFFMLDRRFFDEVSRSLSAVGFKILLDLVASSPRPLRFAELPYEFRPRSRGESKLDLLVGLEYLQLLVYKRFGDVLPPRYVLFGLVGATGVVVHLALLYLLVEIAGAGFLLSQLAATVAAMTGNFFLNNVLTWSDQRLRGRAAIAGLLEFYAACSFGALLNLLVASVASSHGMPWYVAGSAGLVVGSVWNFAVTAATTWRRRRRRAPARSA